LIAAKATSAAGRSKTKPFDDAPFGLVVFFGALFWRHTQFRLRWALCRHQHMSSVSHA
jgi:hypothetical protein